MSLAADEPSALNPDAPRSGSLDGTRRVGSRRRPYVRRTVSMTPDGAFQPTLTSYSASQRTYEIVKPGKSFNIERTAACTSSAST